MSRLNAGSARGRSTALSRWGSVAESARLSPTNHRPGEHGDLYACRDCGTVQQPSLPAGDDLHELYRGVEDEAYLDEEAGRRTTARRLLDLIGRHVPAGRLLDVGCGHGLLLDEARRRGYEVMGLELSASSAEYGREILGLDIHEHALADFSDDEGFDVIVLADVLEHLDDPVAASTAARACWRPAACCAWSRPTRRRPRLGWPARAGGATCRRTPTCCRAPRCASCSAPAAS